MHNQIFNIFGNQLNIILDTGKFVTVLENTDPVFVFLCFPIVAASA